MVKVLRIRNMPTNSATTLATKKTWLLPPSLGLALRARSAASSPLVNAW